MDLHARRWEVTRLIARHVTAVAFIVGLLALMGLCGWIENL